MKKLLLLTLVVMVFSLTLVGCGVAGEDEETLRIGIVYSTGGLGDKSFNDSAHRGLQQAEQELGINFEFIEPRDSAENEDALRSFAEDGFDLVIAVGFQMVDALNIVAAEYPHINFAIIDSVVEMDNVASLVFSEHQGSFLAGALAALVSESGTIGFIGGVDFALIHRFEGGFVSGARYINPDINIISQYAGSFRDPATGKEIALSQIDRGADVIYHASGGTGGGLFEAALEREIFAIGVDSNQNWQQPGFIIASMLKRVDVAVFETVRSLVDGEFEGGVVRVFDLAINGVGITDLEGLAVEEEGLPAAQKEVIRAMKENVTAPHAARIQEIKEGILAGQITVPDWMTEGRPE